MSRTFNVAPPSYTISIWVWSAMSRKRNYFHSIFWTFLFLSEVNWMWQELFRASDPEMSIRFHVVLPLYVRSTAWPYHWPWILHISHFSFTFSTIAIQISETVICALVFFRLQVILATRSICCCVWLWETSRSLFDHYSTDFLQIIRPFKLELPFWASA